MYSLKIPSTKFGLIEYKNLLMIMITSFFVESEVEETVQPPEVLPISSSVLSCTCLSYLLLLTFLVIFL